MKPGSFLSSFWLLTLLLAGWRFTPARAEVAGDFAAANKLYAEGKFTEAATAYDRLLQQTVAGGATAPALWFNYGNVEFKLGHLGLAIAAYRQAELLAPRDSDILGNLAFARNQVQGDSLRPGHWHSWAGSLTLNEGTLLTATFFWLTLGLFITRQLWPAAVPKLAGVTRLAVLVTGMSMIVLAVQAASHFGRPSAVVIEANAAARSGPFPEAQTIFTPHDGAELSVLETHDDWLQVTDGSGKIGWLPRKALQILPGA